MIKKGDIIVVRFDKEVKCGSCGWSTTTLYSFKECEGGLCARCFMELLEELGYVVKVK